MRKQLTTKILALLLCVAMMLSITACGSSTPETTPCHRKGGSPGDFHPGPYGKR